MKLIFNFLWMIFFLWCSSKKSAIVLMIFGIDLDSCSGGWIEVIIAWTLILRCECFIVCAVVYCCFVVFGMYCLGKWFLLWLMLLGNHSRKIINAFYVAELFFTAHAFSFVCWWVENRWIMTLFMSDFFHGSLWLWNDGSLRHWDGIVEMFFLCRTFL